MRPILQHLIAKSIPFVIKFYIIIIYDAYLYALNGVLLQGVLQMNLLNILRNRILTQFPDISSEEMERRLDLAYAIIANIR